MIRKISILVLGVALFGFGCHGQKELIGKDGVEDHLVDAAQLKVTMAVPPVHTDRQAVYLTFTVANDSDREIRFVKWETPFEPRIGKYFEIFDAEGKEAVFKGAMARRAMPPPADAYMVVKPHDKVSTRIDLADNYTFTSGRYQLKYVGGGISGLKAQKIIKFSFGH